MIIFVFIKYSAFLGSVIVVVLLWGQVLLAYDGAGPGRRETGATRPFYCPLNASGHQANMRPGPPRHGNAIALSTPPLQRLNTFSAGEKCLTPGSSPGRRPGSAGHHSGTKRSLSTLLASSDSPLLPSPLTWGARVSLKPNIVVSSRGLLCPSI